MQFDLQKYKNYFLSDVLIFSLVIMVDIVLFCYEFFFSSLLSFLGICEDNVIEQVFEKMLPRYVSILDKHMKTIKQWNRPMMRAVHNLIITIIYGEDYFS